MFCSFLFTFNKYYIRKPGVVTHAFNDRTRTQEADLCEFKADMIYILYSRTLGIDRETLSPKEIKQTTNKQNCYI